MNDCNKVIIYDKLDSMFQKQIQYQIKKGYKISALFKNQQFISIMTLAAIVELSEAIQETPWKPWKKKQELDLPKFKEELVDVLHFFINLCLAAGLTSDDLYNEFVNKNNINIKRDKEGY